MILLARARLQSANHNVHEILIPAITRPTLAIYAQVGLCVMQSHASQNRKNGRFEVPPRSALFAAKRNVTRLAVQLPRVKLI